MANPTKTMGLSGEKLFSFTPTSLRPWQMKVVECYHLYRAWSRQIVLYRQFKPTNFPAGWLYISLLNNLSERRLKHCINKKIIPKNIKGIFQKQLILLLFYLLYIVSVKLLHVVIPPISHFIPFSFYWTNIKYVCFQVCKKSTSKSKHVFSVIFIRTKIQWTQLEHFHRT